MECAGGLCQRTSIIFTSLTLELYEFLYHNMSMWQHRTTHSNRIFLIDSELYWPLIYIQMHLSSSLVTTNYFKHMAVAILNFKYFYVEIYFMITYEIWGRSVYDLMSDNKTNSKNTLDLVFQQSSVISHPWKIYKNAIW